MNNCEFMPYRCFASPPVFKAKEFMKTSLFVKGILLASISLCIHSAPLLSQEVPAFGPETNNSPLATEHGLGMAQFQNGDYGTAILLSYVGGGNVVSTAISINGQAFSDQGAVHVGGNVYLVNCDAGNPETCTPAVAVYGPNNTAYIAFAESNTHGLYVLAANVIPGNANYSFTLAYSDTSVQLTSAPTMIVSPNGQNLLIRYGTSNNASAKNTTYVTEFNGTSWSTYPTAAFAPTQSAMAISGGTLYAIDKQNNSSNGVFVSQLDNNGNQIANTPYQIPGLIVKHGFSAATFKGSVVVCVQADSPDNWFYTFSSSNPSSSTSWLNHQYSMETGPAPQITLFNQGLTEAHQANDSSLAIYSAFATQ